MADVSHNKKGKAKRSRKRKIRTAASSLDDSDDEKRTLDAETPIQPKQAEDGLREAAKRERHKTAKLQDTVDSPQFTKETKSKAGKDVLPKQSSPKPSDSSHSSSPSHQSSRSPDAHLELRDRTDTTPAAVTQPSTDFESWYLRKLTGEFAEDLDKIRSAPDFHDSSLPILIEALRQGASIFTPEEKAKILGGPRQ